MAVTVTMQGIVRTEARPPQTRRWLRRPLSQFRGAHRPRVAISRPLRRPSSGNSAMSTATTTGPTLGTLCSSSAWACQAAWSCSRS